MPRAEKSEYKSRIEYSKYRKTTHISVVLYQTLLFQRKKYGKTIPYNIQMKRLEQSVQSRF